LALPCFAGQCVLNDVFGVVRNFDRGHEGDLKRVFHFDSR